MNYKFRLTFTIGIAIVAMAALGVLLPSHSAATGESTQGGKPVPQFCSPDHFSYRIPNPRSCCQDGNRTWDTDGRRLTFRVHGTPCTEADGVGTNCGEGTSPFVPCTYNQCGTRIEWRVTAEEVHIFRPETKPAKCGWEVKNVTTCLVGCDWPAGTVRQYPEPFLDQPDYPGPIASCPYTNCLVGGIPINESPN